MAEENGGTQSQQELLAQLIHMVADLRRSLAHVPADLEALKQDVGTLKQDVGTLKQDVGTLKQGQEVANQRLDRLETEVAGIRTEMALFRQDMVATVRVFDTELHRRQQSLSEALERKDWLRKEHERQWEARQDDLERRIAELEAAERRRREGAGA